jgi:thioredoxin 1
MGKSKGGGRRRVKHKVLPTISSRDDLDRVISEASSTATEANKKGHLILLKFTASWCGVCQKIKPFCESLANDPSLDSLERSVVLYAVDVDEDASADLTNFYGASSLPLFVFLVDGKKADTMVGAQQTALRKKILKNASLPKK